MLWRVDPDGRIHPSLAGRARGGDGPGHDDRRRHQPHDSPLLRGRDGWRPTSTSWADGWPSTAVPLRFTLTTTAFFEAASKGEKIQGTTQFSRAAAELEIELILAGSPQAKGRVERNHGTNQDRWVKLLRLAGVTTRTEADAQVDRKAPARSQPSLHQAARQPQ